MPVRRVPATVDHQRPRAVEDNNIATARLIVAELFGPISGRTFAVRYWTGTTDWTGDGSPVFTLVLASAGSLRRMVLPPSELAFAEAFMEGAYDIEGDMRAATLLAPLMVSRLRSPPRLARIIGASLMLPRGIANADAGQSTRAAAVRGRRHSHLRDATAVRHHYDVGNDFYRLWLDPQLVYSCGYFASESADLADAQRDKLDLLCRKLRLSPGERLLDIGCGWGALIRHAAKHYGVQAVGITLSDAQAAYAREAIREDGLRDRCSVEIRHFEALPAEPSFHKVVSVGMCEHVGRAKLATYFSVAERVLRPGGLFLNHCITSLEEAIPATFGVRLARLFWRQGEFIDRYVFPDGELATLSQLTAAAEATGLETRDVENLREHYARTLRHWISRLEQRSEEARMIAGETVYRTWRLYMAASEAAFEAGNIAVVQCLYAKAAVDRASRIPQTRDHIYRQR